jgi:hypothetical protein
MARNAEVIQPRPPKFDRCAPIRQQIKSLSEEIDDLQAEDERCADNTNSRGRECTEEAKRWRATRLKGLREFRTRMYTALGECETLPDGPPPVK